MICINCGNKFVRNFPHSRKTGMRVRSTAKLCPKCWAKKMSHSKKKNTSERREK